MYLQNKELKKEKKPAHSFTGKTGMVMAGSVFAILSALICGVANAADYRETSCFYLYKDGQESANTPCKYSYYEDFQRNRKTIILLNGVTYWSSRLFPNSGPRVPKISLSKVIGEFNVYPRGKICAPLDREQGVFLCAKMQ